MSEKNSKSLVERYYTWEKLVLVTSLLLIFRQLFGLIDTTAIPLLNAVLNDSNKFPHAVSIILLIESVFLWIEWKQSEETARRAPLSEIRFSITFIVAFIAVWVNVSALTKGTALEGVSRLWYVFYVFIGLTIGMLIFTLIDIYGETALVVAVRTGQESLVKLFISKGAKIDTRSKLENQSPLDLAHHLGHGKIARLLRKKK